MLFSKVTEFCIPITNEKGFHCLHPCQILLSFFILDYRQDLAGCLIIGEDPEDHTALFDSKENFPTPWA